MLLIVNTCNFGFRGLDNLDIYSNKNLEIFLYSPVGVRSWTVYIFRLDILYMRLGIYIMSLHATMQGP